MLIMLRTISDEDMKDLDVKKTAKNGGISRLCNKRFQYLKRYFETLFMEYNEMILDDFKK